MRRVGAFATIFLLTGTFLTAQYPQRPEKPAVRATGEGTVSAKPDRAQIQIGVVTEATTAQAAASQNAKQTTEVIAELRRVLPAGADLQTSGYSLQPNYRSGPREAPRIVGYIASNTVRVTIDDLTSVGKVIDAATATGANQIRGIHFMVKDEQALRAQALRAAVAQARRNAEAMASGLGLKLGQVLSVEEAAPVVVPRFERAVALAAAADTTTIEPGTIDVRAQVTITVEIVP
mgnify:CR=1 FL=1|jgi:Uncharacterized conserved protein